MDYANPDVLVSTDWVLDHHQDDNVRILEVDEDVLLYDTGHIPGSQKDRLAHGLVGRHHARICPTR